jgi:hypothetical protein
MNITHTKVQTNEDSSSFLGTHESMSSNAPKSVNQPSAVFLLPPHQKGGEDFACEQVDFIEPFTTLSTMAYHEELWDRIIDPAMVLKNQELETISGHPQTKLFCGEDDDFDAGMNYQIDKKYRSFSQTTVDEADTSWIKSNFKEMDNVEPVIDFQHQDDFPFLTRVDTMDTMDAISYFFNSKEDSTPIRPSYYVESFGDDIKYRNR